MQKREAKIEKLEKELENLRMRRFDLERDILCLNEQIMSSHASDVDMSLYRAKIEAIVRLNEQIPEKEKKLEKLKSKLKS